MQANIKLKTISLKDHQLYNEAWVQRVIADDPTLLGIPSVIVKDRERSHKGAGRLDMLLQDEEGTGRYEVEIQLGATDESHIIRTIEYWDLERRRYPQYEHTAVIVAEDITSRFLNVVSLFNGFIPLMAIKMTAIELPEGVALHFTKVLDTVQLGYVDEDEAVSETTTRSYWETQRATPETVKIADRVFALTKAFAPGLEQTYLKNYIGFKLNNRAFNFAVCKPRNKTLNLELKLEKDAGIDAELDASGLDILAYNKHFGRYRISLKENDTQTHGKLLTELLERSFKAHS